jgi:hypothetical protein
MTQWQKTFTREPPKTKAQLREMLTEAVRNTQSGPKRRLRPNEIAVKTSGLDVRSIGVATHGSPERSGHGRGVRMTTVLL